MFKFKPFAVKPSVHDHANFIDIESSSEQRESHLYALLPYKRPDMITLNIPEEHAGIVSKLLGNADFHFELKSEFETPDENATPSVNIERIPDARFAQITVMRAGGELTALLRKTLYELSLEETRTIFLKIPAWRKLPEGMEDKLRDNGFFFAGILPSTPREWHILYVCLKDHKLDFEQIHMHDPLAVELKDYVAAKYTEVIP
jgi:hypothetical protein